MENNLLEFMKLQSSTLYIDHFDESEFIENIDKFKPTNTCYIIHPKLRIPIEVVRYEIGEFTSIVYHKETNQVFKSTQIYDTLDDCSSKCRYLVNNDLISSYRQRDELDERIESLKNSLNLINKIKNEL